MMMEMEMETKWVHENAAESLWKEKSNYRKMNS